MMVFIHSLRKHRPRIAGLLALVAVACMIASAYFFRPTPQSQVHYRPTAGPQTYYNPLALVLFAIGGWALTLALLVARDVIPFRLPAIPRLDRIPALWQFGLVVPGVMALGMVAEINSGLLGIDALVGVGYHVQFALLMVGIGLVAMGLAGIAGNSPHPLNPSRTSGRKGIDLWDRIARAPGRREIAVVIALTVLAGALRFWRLAETARVMVDEAHFTMGVTYFWSFDNVKQLAPMPTSASFPFIFSYGMTWMTEIFGRNFVGLRAFSAILGMLTIPATYLLARHLYDRTTAGIAALLLATFPPHIHYSRLALNNIADPLFGTLALALIARGLHTNRRRDYVLAGVALGLTQYFYEGGRLLFPLLVVVWLGVGFVLWRPQPSLRGVILLGIAFVLVAAPVYVTLFGSDFPVVDRLDKTHMNDLYWNRDREPDNLLTRVRHFHHSLMLYVHMPENTLVYYYLYYGGSHPLVLEYMVPLFLLGGVIAAWRWWTPGVLPAGWILANSVGNAFLVESAVTARYVVVFPAVALLLALGLRHTLALIGRLWGRARDLDAVALALALVLAVTQTAFYFGPFLDAFETEVRQHVAYDVEDALWRAREFPPGTQVHIIADKVLPQIDAQRFMDYLADGIQVVVWSPETITENDLRALSRGTDQVFFVGSDDLATQTKLGAVFGSLPLLTTFNDNVPPDKRLLMVHVAAIPNIPEPQAVG